MRLAINIYNITLIIIPILIIINIINNLSCDLYSANFTNFFKAIVF